MAAAVRIKGETTLYATSYSPASRSLSDPVSREYNCRTYDQMQIEIWATHPGLRSETEAFGYFEHWGGGRDDLCLKPSNNKENGYGGWDTKLSCGRVISPYYGDYDWSTYTLETVSYGFGTDNKFEALDPHASGDDDGKSIWWVDLSTPYYRAPTDFIGLLRLGILAHPRHDMVHLEDDDTWGIFKLSVTLIDSNRLVREKSATPRKDTDHESDILKPLPVLTTGRYSSPKKVDSRPKNQLLCNLNGDNVCR